ncbi:hypothetical protein MAR_023106 [Mya arenaria]|uniref:Uncharacterized protein n=1 Tax=Mya arenaria TaxID=6604 RepID=A0ABY7DNP3_MYAAR|nr:hypothetical protein MAR_023106 [Mya arenaria]
MPLEFVHSPTQQTFDIGSRLTRLLTLLFSLVILFNTIFAFSVLVNLKSLDTCGKIYRGLQSKEYDLAGSRVFQPQEPRWISSDIKRLIRRRKRLYKEAKRSNIPSTWRKFRELRNLIISKIREAKALHIDSISKSLLEKKHSKGWWSTIKQFMSPNSGSLSIPPLVVESGIIHSNADKADAFNTFFANQTHLTEPNSEPVPPTYHISSLLATVVFRPSDIEPLLHGFEHARVINETQRGKLKGLKGFEGRSSIRQEYVCHLTKACPVAKDSGCEDSSVCATTSIWFINSPHSVRTYSLFMGDLRDAGLDASHIMYMSGHRNEASLRSFTREPSADQKRVMSNFIHTMNAGRLPTAAFSSGPAISFLLGPPTYSLVPRPTVSVNVPFPRSESDDSS